jgi:hypothetical protein
VKIAAFAQLYNSNIEEISHEVYNYPRAETFAGSNHAAFQELV